MSTCCDIKIQIKQSHSLTEMLQDLNMTSDKGPEGENM